MNEREVVVVGAGLGAVRLAEQLRRHGHRGPITVVGEEPHRPYDRPPLSKQVLRGERDGTEFAGLDGLDVRWLLGTRVVALDTSSRKIVTDDGRNLGYDVLVLAPGGRARSLPRLDVGPGVHVLRTIDHAAALRDCLRRSNRLIVVGAGFIGCEIAASARQVGCQVDLIEAQSAPLVRVLGAEAASRVTRLHREQGVRLHLGATVGKVLHDDRAVSGVQLGDGTTIDGGDIVVGIGIVPDTGWLDGSGVELDDGIVCDGIGRTNVPNVFGVGDAARWWHPLAGEHRRVEHWTTTADQAATVAEAIVGAGSGEVPELAEPPYFWSDQYEVKIQGIGFIGPEDHVDTVMVRDRPVLLYSRDGVLRGVVGFSIPGAVMRTKALVQRRAQVGEAIGMLTA